MYTPQRWWLWWACLPALPLPCYCHRWCHLLFLPLSFFFFSLYFCFPISLFPFYLPIGAIFVLRLCPFARVLGCPGEDVQTHLVLVSIWWPSFSFTTQEHSLATWLWKPQPCIPDLRTSWNQRFYSWQTTILRALHRQLTKTHPQSFLRRELFACLKPWACGAGFWSGTQRTTQAQELKLKGLIFCILSTISLQLTRIFRKTSLLRPNFSV